MSSGDGEPPTKVVLLLVPRVDAAFHAALSDRFVVLDFFSTSTSSSSSPALPAFLAAAAPSPPRAAIAVGAAGVRIDAAFLAAVPSLRCVVSLAAGVDFIDLPACASRGVAVANSGPVLSTDVADHAVGLLLDVLLRLSASHRLLLRRRHHHHSPPLELVGVGSKVGGRRVGIVGLGNIGSRIARRLQSLGCVIAGYTSRARKDDVPYRFFRAIHDLAVASDVLVVSCALTAATRRIVGRDALNALGPTGVVVNVSRGGTVDEVELVSALEEGRIAGAGLDVFENEPGANPRMFGMDNVVLTPHVAVFTAEAMDDLRGHAVANLEAFFCGRPLLTPVLLP